MTTFRKRGKSWQAQVRRSGAPRLTQSFKTKADAEDWARKVEHDIYAGRLPERRTGHGLKLSEVLERYPQEATPTSHYFG